VSIFTGAGGLGHSAQAVTAAITANAAATPGHNHCLFAGRAGCGLGTFERDPLQRVFHFARRLPAPLRIFLQARLHHPVQSFRAHRLQFAYRPWLVLQNRCNEARLAFCPRTPACR